MKQLLLDSKLKDTCTRERKQLIRQNTHTEERNRDYSAHKGREKKEREREREREKKRKWLGKQCCKEKTKAPCFRQQNPT